MPRRRPATLICRFPACPEEHLPLAQDEVTLGRSNTCDIVLPLPVVSRLHARIVTRHDRYSIVDEGSANGTFLNGKRLAREQQLATDDEIWLGSRDAALTFVDPEETLLTQEPLPEPLVIDEYARAVFLAGAPVSLSPLEYRMLRYLAGRPGAVCTREECFSAVWGQPYEQATCEDALNACVAKLRRNLRATALEAGAEPPQIMAVPRVGFRLQADVAFVDQEGAAHLLRERRVGE
jgi:DNA-binding winged helix-turn-helix (wHTH) protein